MYFFGFSVCFETVLFVSVVSKRVRNTETNRKKLLLVSQNKPKMNRNRLSFGLFRFEPKKKFVCFEDTLLIGGPYIMKKRHTQKPVLLPPWSFAETMFLQSETGGPDFTSRKRRLDAPQCRGSELIFSNSDSESGICLPFSDSYSKTNILTCQLSKEWLSLRSYVFRNL
jgi:hypothetical protein